MAAYSPEFSAYWQTETGSEPSGESADGSSKRELSTEQALALEELAERVFAARSVS
jgi:hypothetical protein